MKRFTSFLTDLPFGVLGFRRRITKRSVRSKKTFMIDTIKEVENRLSVATVDIYASAGTLEELKKDFKEVSQKKREALERLRDVQTKLKFLNKTTEHLRLKEIEIVKDTDQFEKTKKELEAKTEQLKDEPTLDAEIDELRSKVNSLAQELAPSMEKLEILESEKKSHTDAKENLGRELNSVANAISNLQKEMPELQSKKGELEQHFQAIEEVQQQYDDAKEEQNELNSKMEEIKLKGESSLKELDDLNKKKKELQESFMKYQQEKEKLELEIEEMESRKESMDKLNEDLKASIEGRDELTQKQSDQVTKLEIAGKETGDLDRDLNYIEQNKSELGEKRAELEGKSKPVVDVLNQVEQLDETVKKQKDKSEQLSGDVDSRKKDISNLELELHYYKEAIEEIGQKYL